MSRKENRLVRLPAELVKQLHHLYFTGKIKESCRFIQIDDGSFLGERLGYHHLLPFTVTQRMHHAVCQMGNAYQGDGFVHHSLVLFRKSSPETGVGATPQTYQFYDGHIAYIALLRQHHTNDARKLLVGIVPNLFSFNKYVSSKFWLEGRQRTKQRGLPHSISSQQASQLTTVNSGANAVCHHFHIPLTGVTDGKILYMYGFLIHSILLSVF